MNLAVTDIAFTGGYRAMCYNMSIFRRCYCHDIAFTGGYRIVVSPLCLHIEYRYRFKIYI